MADGLERGPMYGCLGSARNTDVSGRWTATGIFLTLQSGAALVGIPLAFKIEDLTHRAMVISGIAYAGLMFAVILLFIIQCTARRLEIVDARLRVLESLDPRGSVFFFSHVQYRQPREAEALPHVILWWLTLVLIGIWSILMIASFDVAMTLS